MHVRVSLVMVVLLALGARGVESAQVVGATTATPTTVAVGIGTPVTVVSAISDPSLIASSVVLQRVDAAGRVIATYGPLRDDGTGGDGAAGDGLFTIRPTIYETVGGPVTLRVSAAFLGKLTRAFSAPLTLTVSGTSTAVGIVTPGNLAYLNTTPIQVTGTVGDPGATVTVNGVPATVSEGSFLGTVPLLEGTNTLTAVATNTNGTTTTASVQVTLDTTPPRLTVTGPAEGFTTVAPTVAVSGLVNDLVVGTINDQQATVTVNGTAAQVANRSFLAASVPLAVGANLLQVTGTDRTGNGATASVTVHRVLPTMPTIQGVSGSNQTAAAGSVLPQPLVAQVRNEAGQPVSGVPVVFAVTQNSGGLVSGTAALGALAVPTDAEGQARVAWRTGSRSGVGNNEVQATAVGFAGTAVFVASGTPAGASRIVVDTGNGQTGVVGSALPLPFVAIVTDAGYNRLAGVPVTFTVRQGGGLIDGAATVTRVTDSDGRVAVGLTLGKPEGFDNNVVEATFAGNPGAPVAFLASARVPADPAATRVTGVVLDNSNAPIAGVTLRLFRTHHGTGVPEQVAEPVLTDEQGQFVIQPAPVGAFKLMADGATAPNGPWPTLEFDVVTVAGQPNDVGLPIYLPALDAVHRLCVDETTGGTLTLPAVPGFALTIAPGAATFPGGARTGCVTVTPVNGDKVPMAPGFGQQPRFVVTIQPVGTVFNPPAQLTLPNVDGLAPRAMTELYSYDHDLAAFVSIGTGTVSEDGAVIVSDPGVGVIKAGWHCGGNPNPTGTAATCPTCYRCVNNECRPEPNGTTCDDRQECTVNDRCTNGSCTGEQVTVTITGAQPDIGNVCPGCTMQFTATITPAGRTVTWTIVSDATGAASISGSGLLTIGGSAASGSVTVRARDSERAGCGAERTVTVFAPPPIPRISGGIFNGMTTAERDFAVAHPLCTAQNINIQSEAFDRMNALFPEELRNDPNVGNAFLHAYANCLFARRCGVDLAEQFWNAHEQHDANTCTNASMDFHNNQVGRSVSTQSGDCADLVLEQINDGAARWMNPPPAAGACPTFQNTAPTGTPSGTGDGTSGGGSGGGSGSGSVSGASGSGIGGNPWDDQVEACAGPNQQ